VLINLFGGINNCEVMACGIADVVTAPRPSVPIIVKMRGHSQGEGWRILDFASRIIPTRRMENKRGG
jgi:succinyl-CoA synthetase beta subunit